MSGKPVLDAAQTSSRFSTDCSAYQDWQSELVFNSALLVGHAGPLTRIAYVVERVSLRYAFGPPL